LPTTPPLFPL